MRGSAPALLCGIPGQACYEHGLALFHGSDAPPCLTSPFPFSALCSRDRVPYAKVSEAVRCVVMSLVKLIIAYYNV